MVVTNILVSYFVPEVGGTLETMEQNMNNESSPGEAHK